ncbi:TetR/AcrR family transcriptional regulator [Maledivibacter halophilus]|uniref:Transcriptional regulator, TetR family n=1 Tax=Maledivibacter halophilus TaxID=36842 RepID=A0A1T5M5T5_9FIRM|nr:TetR/AcrR family transcriptional regulator [Maledivibacter halophilus]SKC83188.1 transcriptional regulator, TetR family [Maledivibacter halophilus]
MEGRKSKREVIIGSAVKIFERDGFYKAKVEEIAKGANVGKGTIYEYFSSKRDLFCQMVKDMLDSYVKMVEKISQENGDPVTKLKKLIQLQMTLMEKHGKIAQIIQIEAIKSGLQEELKKYFLEVKRNHQTIIEKIFQEGIELKIFKPVDTFLTSLFFIGGVNQFAFEKEFMKTYHSDKELNVEKFMEAFLKGIIK